MNPTERTILCEGFHDRAFWAGWLLSLGCVIWKSPTGGSGKLIQDPWGDPISNGQFAYRSASGHFLRVCPCNGVENILSAARVRLKGRATKPLARLIINIDPDTDSASPLTGPAGLMERDVLQEVRKLAPDAELLPNKSIEADQGATLVQLIRWEVNPIPDLRGVPTKNTLERLVSLAIAEAYPGRGDAVDQWLALRPDPPPPDPKAHARSYFAGWYADGGCDFFYQRLWSDSCVRDRLQAHLTQSGAWEVVQQIVS